MIAILDCNSFYCSCERVFKPALANKPVVVLSNNDGCIIARSDEAKAIGVGMAGPYFKAKPLIEQYGVAVFSSNYNLYGDMSWRVMETLRIMMGKENVEVYSVDECFINLKEVPKDKLHEVAVSLKETVEMWTGIKVSVGVAPTKVLSKVANRLAKKNKLVTNCVLVLDSPRKVEQALQKTLVEDIWGVGGQYAEKLRTQNIITAYDLSKKDITWCRKHLGGVVGERLLRELKSEVSIQMEAPLVEKKIIATTRMFGSPVADIKSIKEAVATYTARAAEKLRRQYGAAKTISVFVVPKEQNFNARFRHGPSIGSCTKLFQATSLTNELIKPAVALVDKLFEEGRVYKKAGVMLSDITMDSSIQGDLFLPNNKNKERLLMSMMDNVNFSMRDDVLKFAASGTVRNWKMQKNFHSPRYTTRWDEICMVT
jgi:DNA polymerase V